MAPPRVIVLADDLIWSSRLTRTLTDSGAIPVSIRTTDALERLLGSTEDELPKLAIVDLTALGYEPVGAIERIAGHGLRVLAVGQHDDLALRKRALAAGAERVFAYRKLFEDGPATIGAWLQHRPEEATA